ncbi:MAG: LptF/LptG family permease, partial [Bacteroidota bacterium]|nr:LptF/LptG family permease [Bacteroidota bacterium]
MVEFNNKVLPEANHRLKTLMMDIRRKKPTFTLVPGLFSQDMPGYSILVRKTFANSNDLEGVIIYDYTDPNKNVMISARHGVLSFSPDYRNLIMDLYDGEIHQLNTTDFRTYRIIKFQRQRLVTKAEGFDFERSSENAFSRGQRELSAGEMRYIVDSLRTEKAAIQKHIRLLNDELTDELLRGSVPPQSPDIAVWNQINLYTTISSRMMMFRNMLDMEYFNLLDKETGIREYMVEIHKKYSIPVACLVFVLVGAPLGVMTRRSGFGMAGSLSLGFFLLYWASLIGGEKLADREYIQPWLGMWIANIVIGAVGIFLTVRMGHGNIELQFDWWKRLKEFFVRKKLNHEGTKKM